jgi:putative Holliday junction resolvase
MKYLAIDFGEKNIGIAISDDKGIIAQPFTVIKRKSDDDSIEKVAAIISSEKITALILGIPAGAAEETLARYNSFSRKLQEKTKMPVKTWDETFSTKQARNVLGYSDAAPTAFKKDKRSRHNDSVAAAIILQQYLDNEKGA